MILVTCRHCRNFAQGHGSLQAIGLCGSIPWDGYRGQWPDRQHPCANFAAQDSPR